MLNKFRTLSLIEGSSLLILLFIAMPAKYYLGMGMIVPIVGMAHGVLFLTFLVMSLMVSHQQNWSVLKWLAVLFAGVLPFAFIVLERSLKRESMATA